MAGADAEEAQTSEVDITTFILECNPRGLKILKTTKDPFLAPNLGEAAAALLAAALAVAPPRRLSRSRVLEMMLVDMPRRRSSRQSRGRPHQPGCPRPSLTQPARGHQPASPLAEEQLLKDFDELTKAMPPQMRRQLWVKLNSYKYETKPNYSYIRSLLRDMFEAYAHHHKDNWDITKEFGQGAGKPRSPSPPKKKGGKPPLAEEVEEDENEERAGKKKARPEVSAAPKPRGRSVSPPPKRGKAAAKAEQVRKAPMKKKVTKKPAKRAAKKPAKPNYDSIRSVLQQMFEAFDRCYAIFDAMDAADAGDGGGSGADGVDVHRLSEQITRVSEQISSMRGYEEIEMAREGGCSVLQCSVRLPSMSDEEVTALWDAIPFETRQAEKLELEDDSHREWLEFIRVRNRVLKVQARRFHAKYDDKLEAARAEKASHAAKELHGLQAPAGPYVQLPPPAFAAANLPPPLVPLPPAGTFTLEEFALLPMAEVPPMLRRAHVGALRQGCYMPEFVHMAFTQELSMAMGLE
ncbi:unnamed protein product [Vitrella brassicaformis CCMP3155]|uniref:Uncharacterized protein n=1 Tax=Vitrella brassicaformis (strain CCMP3155) TaxID=1169540 RepID=A0A0G4ECZ0_VITBC|nr:unnamed protein product [Vitrella brassicaformis CCMP3155]|eukprot:CEL93199.1 unnamed protein product [Vitrella brassicaformis CCMP3155]